MVLGPLSVPIKPSSVHPGFHYVLGPILSAGGVRAVLVPGAFGTVWTALAPLQWQTDSCQQLLGGVWTDVTGAFAMENPWRRS